jgi:hypothetical protein
MEPERVFRAIRHKPNVYIERELLDSTLRTALAVDSHILLYGPAGQGKTTLLLRHVDLADCCIIDCRSDLKRSDIYRILLASAGYTVITERRRKGKLGTSAQLKLFGSSLGGEAGGELETHATELTADLTSGTEVAGLLSKTNPKKFLVLNNFDVLSEGTQKSLLREIGIFDEWSSLRFILSGRWSDRYYAEKLFTDIAGHLDKIHVPFWSKTELHNYLLDCSSRLDQPLPLPIIDAILSISGGDIGLCNQLALLFFSSERGSAGGKELDVNAFLQQCKDHLARRYSEIYLSKLLRFAGNENLQLLFVKSEKVLRNRTSTRTFKNFDEIIKEFGPEKAREIEPKLKKDGQGLLHYSQTKRATENRKVPIKVYIGLWILALFFHPKNGITERKMRIDELIMKFKEHFLAEVLPYSEKKLRKIMLSIADAQKEDGIIPEILSIDETEGTVSISNRQIEIFFEAFEAEDVYDEIKEHVNSLPINDRVRKRGRIALEDSDRSVAERVAEWSDGIIRMYDEN